MSPPQLGVGDEGKGNVSLVDPAPTSLGLKERNYLGFSDCSSVDVPAMLISSEDSKINLNLKATELRLGLPGSQSPERETDPCFVYLGKFGEKPLFPSKDGICMSTQKNSGNKRVFSDTMDGLSGVKSSTFKEKWMFNATGSGSKCQQFVGKAKLSINSGINAMLLSRPSMRQTVVTKELSPKATQEQPRTTNGKDRNDTDASNNSNSGPAVKAQVVGWPPIRSFRKNSLATASKNSDEVDGKPSPEALFVKVSMDGAPYLRKVDLKTYSTYQELSCALEKMFSCFTIGQCGSHGAPGRDMLSESKLRDLLHGSEYVLTYEDKDKDWMLVGDVPWEYREFDIMSHTMEILNRVIEHRPRVEVIFLSRRPVEKCGENFSKVGHFQYPCSNLRLFIDLCKRLKIMKSSDAIGLAPRAMEKSKDKS